MNDSPTTIAPANIPAADAMVDRSHNNPPGLLTADELLARFRGADGEPGQYTNLQRTVTDLLAEIGGRVDGIAGAPLVIETDADNGIVAAHMENLRSTIKTVDNHREAEKAPYLTAERAIQNFFAEMLDRLTKTRTILQARGDDYTARKAAEARRLRQIEAEKAAAAAREAAAEAARKAQEARDLEAAAARARKPENIAALEQQAETVATQAAMADVDRMIAASTAENAKLATMAPSADLVRVRHSGGQLSTGKQVGYAEITDISKLDLNVLRQFIKPAHLDAALKAWAKINDYKVQMEGASIGKRDAADYR